MKELVGGATDALFHHVALPPLSISLSHSPLSISLSLTLGFGQGKEMTRVPTGRGWTLFFYPMKVVVVVDHNRMAGLQFWSYIVITFLPVEVYFPTFPVNFNK
jgi:hypothetical protein